MSTREGNHSERAMGFVKGSVSTDAGAAGQNSIGIIHATDEEGWQWSRGV